VLVRCWFIVVVVDDDGDGAGRVVFGVVDVIMENS